MYSNIIVLYLSILLVSVRADWALLSAVSHSTLDSTSQQLYCVVYSDEWNLLLPSKPTHYVELVIPDSNQDGCHNYSSSYDGAAVLIDNANCSVHNKLHNAQLAGVQLLLIAGTLETKGLTNPPITMVILSKQSAASLDDNVAVSLYLPSSRVPYGGIILLFTITMVTLITSSALANQPLRGLLYRDGNSTEANALHKLQLSVYQLGLAIVLLIGLAITFLILLYLFYSVVVFIAIGLYCLLCVTSVFSFVSPFVALVPFTSQWRVPANHLPIFKHRPDPRFFFTILFSVGLVLSWFLLRHSKYAWMLHDLLGFMFICFAIKQFKGFLRYLWPLAVLMIGLFVYDIFFVFITPLITENNVSVMETVATGKGTGSNEKIPFLFEVPRLTHLTSLESTCDLASPLLLGYGDIGVPGMLVSFALHVDKIFHPQTALRAYYITTVTGYAVGFLLCIIALTLMKTGQPALLYLIPCTLGPFIITALIRGDFLVIWRGKKHIPKSCHEEQKNESNEQCEKGEQPLLCVNDEKQ